MSANKQEVRIFKFVATGKQNQTVSVKAAGMSEQDARNKILSSSAWIKSLVLSESIHSHFVGEYVPAPKAMKTSIVSVAKSAKSAVEDLTDSIISSMSKNTAVQI